MLHAINTNHTRCLTRVRLSSASDWIGQIYITEFTLSLTHGGGFFLMCEDSGRKFDNSSPACLFFFKV